MKCKCCGHENTYIYRENGIHKCSKCKKPMQKEHRKQVFSMKDSAGIIR